MYAAARLCLAAFAILGATGRPAAAQEPEAAAVAARPTCVLAKNRCVNRNGCAMALHNVVLSCTDEMRPPSPSTVDATAATGGCGARCRRALVSLLSVDDGLGSDYLACDCAGNVNCELIRSRLGVCAAGVSGSLRRLLVGGGDGDAAAAPPVSCSLAKLLCEADTACGTALHFYELNCRGLWTAPPGGGGETKCGRKCNNSLSVLYRQPRASKLQTCVCDSEDSSLSLHTCLRMRQGTERHCLQREPAKQQQKQRQQLYYYDGAIDEGGGDEALARHATAASAAASAGAGGRHGKLENARDSSSFGAAEQGHSGASNYGPACSAAVVGWCALPLLLPRLLRASSR